MRILDGDAVIECSSARRVGKELRLSINGAEALTLICDSESKAKNWLHILYMDGKMDITSVREVSK